MAVPDKLLEIGEWYGDGYKPMVDYGAWRVAYLRYHDELLPENITSMQKHDETDEVFVLMAGRCILFLGTGGNSVVDVVAQDMELFKIYNVKRSAWHTHTLSTDAVVLIVENVDTTLANSPLCDLTSKQRQKIIELTRSLW